MMIMLRAIGLCINCKTFKNFQKSASSSGAIILTWPMSDELKIGPSSSSSCSILLVVCSLEALVTFYLPKEVKKLVLCQ